ncbi:hypothetical protein RBU49_01835 [Clostridium sp. MB40-C1]|uniref:hypothetical protein n=1 Tax=Clostridium sp. MB40-C1 TaxID=3070996 RepID=UPI0027DF2249|nr:hypothetical protein [Clostridium sp. MB40-C1]WMJ81019.1 hypothetical protein RBU49_01835 [Clostridium sp. MB40-C1]
MKNNSCIKNIIYLILIVVLFTVGVLLLTNYKFQLQRTFEHNLVYITFIIIIFFGGIGIVLGLDNHNVLLKKEGTLKVDKPKLLILGIPSFIFSTAYIWGYLGLGNIIPNIFLYLIENDYIVVISSIILGYTVTSSFYKN